MSPPCKRLRIDLVELMTSGYKVGLDRLITDGVREFYVDDFHGPKDSLYESGIWRIRVELPDDYPFKSPSISFTNKIYHPNIDETSGSVCLSQSWSPAYHLVTVFEVLLPHLLLYPNPLDPWNGEAAALMMRDKDTYEQRVREYCERYAKPEDVGAAPEEKSSDEELTEDEYASCEDEYASSDDEWVMCT